MNAETVCRDMIEMSSEVRQEESKSILPDAKIIKPKIKKLGKIILKVREEESAATEMLKESLKESKKEPELVKKEETVVTTAPGDEKPKIKLKRKKIKIPKKLFEKSKQKSKASESKQSVKSKEKANDTLLDS